jgi:hypothetical protein
MPPQMKSGCHMGSMCPCHVINPSEASSGESNGDKDRRAHSVSKSTQKLIHTKDVHKVPHVIQLEEGVDRPGPQGFGRTDLGSADPGLPCGGVSLVQGSIPRCFLYSSVALPAYK